MHYFQVKDFKEIHLMPFRVALPPSTPSLPRSLLPDQDACLYGSIQGETWVEKLRNAVFIQSGRLCASKW